MRKLKPIQQAILESLERLTDIYEGMPTEEQEALHKWEVENLDGHSVKTTDWPGWRKYLQ